MDYLSRLVLSPQERARLADLGAASPLAILGIQRAAPQHFESLFGAVRAEEIAAQLAALLSESERAILEAPPPPRRPLGALLDPPPGPLRVDLPKGEPSKD